MGLDSVPVPDKLLTLLISSFLLVLAIILLRFVMVRMIRSWIASVEIRRRWLVQTRNALFLLLTLGLIIIWGAELRTFALSIVAIAVAFVVATKELILCATGSILKAGAGSFQIGDRIQIKDFRGDVIDQNLFATTIMEIGPGKLTHQRTGRVIVLPNSLFVSEPVTNESYTHEYVLHVFTVPFRRSDNWRGAQQALLAAARKHCQAHLSDARKHMRRLAERQGLDAPSVDPRVTVQVPAPDEIHLVVRVPVNAAQRGGIEQAILADLFREGDFQEKPDEPPAESGQKS